MSEEHLNFFLKPKKVSSSTSMQYMRSTGRIRVGFRD